MARKIKAGDMVEVISGAGAPQNGKPGKIGKVLRVLTDRNKIVVEGVNRVWKHVRPSQRYPQGGRIQKDAPIHISNVLPVDPATGRGSRVKFKTEGTTKTRVTKGGTVLSTLTK
jgi:large subunit ribosomal protein L24